MNKIDKVKHELNKMVDECKIIYNEELLEVSQCLDKMINEQIKLERNMEKKKSVNKLEFEELINILPCAIYVIRESLVIDCNKGALDIFGYENKKDIIGLMTYELSPKYQDDGKLSIVKGHQIIEDNICDKKSIDFQWRYKRKNGEEFLSQVNIINNEDTLYVIITDISEKSHPYYKLFENHNSVILVTDPETGKIIEANKAAIQYYGYSKEKILSMNINEINMPGDAIKQEIALETEEDRSYFHSTHRLSNDINREVEVYGIQVEAKKEKLLFLIVYDVEDKMKPSFPHAASILSKGQEAIKNQVYRIIELQQKDSLTGLYNREHFLEVIDKHINDYRSNKEKFSIIVVDIDEFKDINDAIGHNIGDNLLIKISKRISSLIKDSSLVSRIDGDEYAILYESVNKKDLLSFTKQLLRNISQPYKISNAVIYLNFNVGISRFPEDGLNSEKLVRFANVALNKSKKRVEERVCFYSNDISIELVQKVHLANYLFSSISNNELSVYYQPIFNILEKNIVGAEALLRWSSPILGNVPPDKFIPVAEKTGQIFSIGEWVIKEVCRQIGLWKQKGYRLMPISINVSVKQLEQVEFAETVINILKAENIKAKSIELEITESVSSGDIVKIVKNIKKLKNYGIKISMDDFGTGFSSLGQLDIFELDKLKIDKVFINDLANGVKGHNMVKSIIAMAKSLNLLTVAEGIETHDQLFQLKGLGCQLGQGFLLSEPLDVNKIEILLSHDKEFKYNDCLES